eukprot:TRINITY_DN50571_c0_g1_i1.p2 TRINITY_DN50571_c0_g1~~TRINITY_DN50571_c0_g1_i1.p2  ORF type:complete len:336 (+),score=107.37 TRINITY_DN50571_c0_g1_i1:74-1009(+)
MACRAAACGAAARRLQRRSFALSQGLPGPAAMERAARNAATERAFAAMCRCCRAGEVPFEQLREHLDAMEAAADRVAGAAAEHDPATAAGRWRDPIVDSSAARTAATAALTQGLGSNAAALLQLRTHAAAQEDDGRPTAGMYSAALRLCKTADEAEGLLATATARRPALLRAPLFNVFLAHCSERHDGGRAVRCYDEMRRRGVRPDSDTFAHVLTALAPERPAEGEGLTLQQLTWAAQQGFRLWDEMRKYRVPATVRTHAALLRLLPPADEQLSRQLFSDLDRLGAAEGTVEALRRYREKARERWEGGQWP